MAEASLPSTWSKVANDLHANSLWILPLVAFERAFDGFTTQAVIAGALWLLSAVVAVQYNVLQEVISNDGRRQRVLTWALILGGMALLAFGVIRLASQVGNSSGLNQQDINQQVGAATAPLRA